MLVDGRKIAETILDDTKNKVSGLSVAPRMVAITCAPNFETQRYLEMKVAKASSAGVILSVVELPQDATTEQVIDCVREVGKEADGIVVQLPMPVQIDREKVLSAVPADKDPDGFKYGKEESACLSPVVGAIDEISKVHKVEWEGKRVVVLGEGRLVGIPSAHYAKARGAEVSVLNENTYSVQELISADIIVTGIGSPNFIKAESVKEGVIIFDAGTSEDGGELTGDVDSSVAPKASLLTPVPGGIGPITIAYLLRNLVSLAVKI